MLKKSSSRRNFIAKTSTGLFSILASAGSVAAMTTPQRKEKVEDDDDHVFLTMPYLQAPLADGITIMWLTKQLCLNWIECGESYKLGTVVKQTERGFLNTNSRINCVTLTGLKPRTKYFYKVYSKQILNFQPYKMTYGKVIESDIHSFTTFNPEANEVNWLVLNDIHDRPDSFNDLLKLNGSDPHDFVFLNGDMFDYQTDEKQIIDHLLTPCNSFSAQMPFLFVRGNHETRGKYSRDLPRYYHNYNGSEYYSFKHGPAFIIVLDTGEDKPDSHPVYGGANDFDAYREEQAAWLEKMMQTKDYRRAKFRVVMMHIPHMHSDEEHGTRECNRLFAPLFEKYKIDLFVAGHTHEYGMYEPEAGKHSYHFVIGGGPLKGNRTLIKISANNARLQLQMLRDDNTEIGKFLIESKR